MNQLESFLQSPPPFVEAAAFLIRLKGEKTASAQEVLEGIDELEGEERVAVLKAASALPLLASHGKLAMMGGAATAPVQLPPQGRGQNMAPPTPPALPATAMGMNMGKSAAATPEAVGKERGRAATSAHFERESHRHGERSGSTLGRLVGLAGGAAAAHHIGKGNPVASIAGAALGQHVGAQVGRQAGRVSDERHYAKHAEAFKQALEGMGGGEPQAPQGIQPQISPETAEFLAAEQEADGAATTQQLAFVRQKFQEAVAAQQAAEERASQLEATQATTDQTLAQYQAQIADSTQKAMMAQDEILQQQQGAAAMRMAYQQLRGTLLQAASTDPPSLSGNQAALAAASTMAGPQSAPGPQTGPAGQSPNPGTPNTVAPLGDDQVSQQVQPNEPTFSNASPTTAAGTKEPADGAKIPNKEVLASVPFPFVGAEKLSSLREFLSIMGQGALPEIKKRAPYAAIGALAGGATGFAESQMSNEPLRQKVQDLEANPNRGARDAIRLGALKERLTLGEHAEKHPVAATMMSALTGAGIGAAGGPSFVDALKSLKNKAGPMAQDIKTIVSK